MLSFKISFSSKSPLTPEWRPYSVPTASKYIAACTVQSTAMLCMRCVSTVKSHRTPCGSDNFEHAQRQRLGFAFAQCARQHAAQSCIAGFQLTNANYMKAVKLMQKRFGQQDKIADALMQGLIQLPSPSNAPTVCKHFPTDKKPALEA